MLDELSKEERKKGREAVEKIANEKYDLDGDGELSTRERTAAMREDPQESERLYFLWRQVEEPREGRDRRRRRSD